MVKVRHVHHAHHKRGVMRLRELAVTVGDPRVLMLAQKIRGKGDSDPFGAVTDSVDEMIADLKKEEEADIAEKEMCELERSRNTQKVREYSKRIDMSTHVIERLTQLIADKQKEIDGLDAEIKELEDSKVDATAQRDKEKAEYAVSVQEDTTAIGLVENSMKVLESFYKNNDLKMGFVEVKQADEVEQPGGVAPTPPPATWDDPDYKGASKETGGVVSLLGMIKADIEKDIRNADKEESDAQAAYDKMFADTDITIDMLKGTKSDLEKMISTDQTGISSQKGTRQTDQDSMQTHIDFLKSIATACDFMAANFESRAMKRAEEIDGLNNAKAIFQGAEFKEEEEE